MKNRTMKMSLKVTMMLSLIAIFFTSCFTSGGGRDNNRDEVVDNTNLMFYAAESNFYGAAIDKMGYRSDNSDSYVVWFDDSELAANPKGDGVFLFLDLNTPVTSQNEIIAGNYVANRNDDAAPMTYNIGSWITNQNGEKVITGSFISSIQKGKEQIFPVSNGMITFKHGSQYNVTGSLVAGGKQFNIRYNGLISFTDFWSPVPSFLNQGELWYNGNLFNNGLNVFTIRLWDDFNNNSRFTGRGDAMQIELYTYLSDSKIKLANGRYPVYIDNPKPYSVIDAFYENGTDFGTWYYTSDYFMIENGYVDIQWKTGSTYKIDLNLTDNFYNRTIVGTYEGELAFINKTNEAFAVKPQRTKGENDKSARVQTQLSYKEHMELKAQKAQRDKNINKFARPLKLEK